MSHNEPRAVGIFPTLFRKHEAVSGDHAIDVAVLACVVAAFLTSIKSMGGAAAQGTDWPLRWLSAGLALHAYAINRRARNDRARLRLVALLPAAGALAFLIDGLIHPATAWKAHHAAATAAMATVAFWLTTHHTRHVLHRRLIFGIISVTCALLGALTYGDAASLAARLAGRMPDAVYAGHATGPFGTPGEFVALMLIGFFATAAHALLPRKNLLQRMSALYAAALIFTGILAADTIAGRYGITVGFAALGLLWFRTIRARAVVLIAAAGILRVMYVAHAGQVDAAGIFRTAGDVAPLTNAAASIFFTHPLTGTGCGGFMSAFEAHRPPGWPLNPDGAGGLFHHLLAENGLIGTMMILGPALLLLILGIRRLLSLPRIETEYDRQYDKTARFTPEFPLSLFSACAGGVACLTALSFDYARSNVAVILALTMIGGSLIRQLPSAGLPMIRIGPPATPAAGRRRWALAAIPCLLLPACTIGVLESAEHVISARDMLGKLSPNTSPAGAQIDQRIRLEVLAGARENAERALSFAPGNAEAKLVLADTILAKFRTDASGSELTDALALAECATTALPARPEAAFTRIELLRSLGRTADATAAVNALYAAAPNHPAAALEYARTHLANPEKHREITRLLTRMLESRPHHEETRRLLNLIRLTES